MITPYAYHSSWPSNCSDSRSAILIWPYLYGGPYFYDRTGYKTVIPARAYLAYLSVHYMPNYRAFSITISSLSGQNVCAYVVSIPHDNKSNEKIRCRTTAHQTVHCYVYHSIHVQIHYITENTLCHAYSKCLDYVRKVICYTSMHLLMLWHSILMNTRLLTDYKTKIFLAWRHLEILVLRENREHEERINSRRHHTLRQRSAVFYLEILVPRVPRQQEQR